MLHYQVLVAIWLLVVICEGMKASAETAKAVAKATITGKVFTVADGISVFDKQGNPDKSMNDVV